MAGENNTSTGIPDVPKLTFAPEKEEDFKLCSQFTSLIRSVSQQGHSHCFQSYMPQVKRLGWLVIVA